MKLKNLILIFIIILISSQICKSHNLFFDLNGVLLEANWWRAMKKLGFQVIGHPKLKSRLFEFMHLIDKNKSKSNNAGFQGEKLPSFLCDWQKGKLSCKDVTDFIVTQADKNPEFFKSKTEQKLIKRSAELFLSKNNIEITTLIPGMINIIKQCKDKKDQNGKPLNTLFLTSNFDEETFELVKKEFPQVISLFDKDKLIISASIGQIKPDKGFFKYVIKKFKLDPKDCYLIDDTPENIEGAKKCEINGIHYKSTSQVTKELKKINAI